MPDEKQPEVCGQKCEVYSLLNVESGGGAGVFAAFSAS
jgi:hypothetical protein